MVKIFNGVIIEENTGEIVTQDLVVDDLRVNNSSYFDCDIVTTGKVDGVDISDLNNHTSTIDSQIAQINESLSTINPNITSLNIKVNKNTEDITILTETTTSLNTKVNKNTEDITTLTTQVNTNKQDITTLTETTETLDTKISNLSYNVYSRINSSTGIIETGTINIAKASVLSTNGTSETSLVNKGYIDNKISEAISNIPPAQPLDTTKPLTITNTITGNAITSKGEVKITDSTDTEKLKYTPSTQTLYIAPSYLHVDGKISMNKPLYTPTVGFNYNDQTLAVLTTEDSTENNLIVTLDTPSNFKINTNSYGSINIDDNIKYFDKNDVNLYNNPTIFLPNKLTIIGEVSNSGSFSASKFKLASTFEMYYNNNEECLYFVVNSANTKKTLKIHFGSGSGTGSSNGFEWVAGVPTS